MTEFRFAHPTWIHLLWAVLALACLLVFLEVRGRSVLERFVSRWMQPRLVRRLSLLRRLSALAFVMLALIVLVFALMRPQWGTSVQRTVRIESQIMICLDVSKSMLAEDVAPSRLERAKIELDSLLGLMNEGQQVGLIAFAGKAAVLCPMTTDFGFLRLVLAEVAPTSVGLGGTQIGDAIRTAVEGFGESGDMNRLIILVTDGEDHDSYPLEAAKAAREKGVKIVSIGFGDEAGSKIEITDPETGTRSFLQDRNGQDVVSHLDGETLRDVALQTEGAYVPAGTGALDLDSIYRTYIATLLQGSTDSETQVVRYEAYQWLVLAALLLWLAGLVLATPWNLRAARVATAADVVTATARTAALLMIVQLLAAASSAMAQTTPPPAASPAPANAQAAKSTADNDKAAQDPEAAKGTAGSPDADPQADPTREPVPTQPAEEPLVPREAYNRALAFINSDAAEAERYLNRARRDAGSDGELRYRALYNLGWVEVTRADALLKDDPKQALQHLQQAANRFREAVRVRPESTAARQNLEITAQRVLELTDALSKQDPGDLRARLDELIEQLRGHQAQLQAIVQQTGAEVAQTMADTYRQDFRRLGVTQREVLADVQLFADDVRKELDAIGAKPDDQKSPQDQLQVGQYTNMLRFLDTGLQRLSQSRSLTRRLQGDRAFRRWSAGLADLKRARDQLRDPVELLSHIINDSTEIMRMTGTLSAADSQPAEDAPEPTAPTWLTREYLQEQQTAALDRTKELEQVLAAAAPKKEALGPQPTPGTDAAASPGSPAPDLRTKQLIDNIPKALPLINNAVAASEAASQELASGSLANAQARQAEAIAALMEASEWFFDMRRLIEAMYANQLFVSQGVHSAQPDLEMLRQAFAAASVEKELTAEDVPGLLRQIAATLAPMQKKNTDRAPRLAQMFDFELEQLQNAPPPAAPQAPATAPGAAAPTEPSEEQQTQLQRFELAKQLLTQISSDMDRALAALDALKSETAGVPSNDAPQPVEPAKPDEPTTAEPVQGDAAAKPPEPTAEPAAPTEPPTTAEPPAATSAPRDPRWTEAEAAADQALASLEELRRLFFSLVEHLRDTAQRQANLNDETTRQSAEPAESQTPDKIGPLANRQSQLQPITQAIGEALAQQSKQAAAQPPPPPGTSQAADPADAQEAAAAAGKTLAEAAELVQAAQEAMSAAAKQLEGQTTKFDAAAKPYEAITQQQRQALDKLAAALALLDQSQQPPDEQQPQDQNQQQQEQSQGSEDQQRQQQQNMSASQLLQLIRDREAQRREDQKQKVPPPRGAVDKDW